MLEVLSGIILNTLTNSQLVQFGLIPSIDKTFTTDYLQNSAFVNVVNSYHGEITLIEANQNLYIILGRITSSCLNGTFRYLAYNLSSLGTVERRSFDNVTRVGGDVIHNIEYTIFSSGDSSSSSSILGSSSAPTPAPTPDPFPWPNQSLDCCGCQQCVVGPGPLDSWTGTTCNSESYEQCRALNGYYGRPARWCGTPPTPAPTPPPQSCETTSGKCILEKECGYCGAGYTCRPPSTEWEGTSIPNSCDDAAITKDSVCSIGHDCEKFCKKGYICEMPDGSVGPPVCVTSASDNCR